METHFSPGLKPPLTDAFLRCGHSCRQRRGPPAERPEPMTTPTPPPPHQNLTHRFKSVAFFGDYHPRIFQRGGFSSRLTNVRFMNPNRARFWADLCASLSDLSNYRIYQRKVKKVLRFPHKMICVFREEQRERVK
jgi:hypothetical protein